MKKAKILTIVLVVSVMLLGAGYAYWTQELNINTTVSTGDLKLEFLPLLLDEYLDDHEDYDNKKPYDEDYMDVDLVFNSDKLVVDFKDIYPGAGGYLRFRIGNSGTVPAKVTNLEGIVTGGTKDQLNKFNYKVQSLTIYTPIPGLKYVGGDKWWEKLDPNNYEYYEKIIVLPDLGEANIIEADTFDEFISELEERLSKYTLEPYSLLEINGEGAGYHIELPSSIKDEDEMENLDGLGFNINITFTQGE